MGNGKNRYPWFACCRIEKSLYCQRLTCCPAAEGGTGKNIIELHGQLHTLGLGEKNICTQAAYPGKRRVNYCSNEHLKGHVLLLTPKKEQQGREQDMLTAFQGVSIDPHQSQEGADRRIHQGASRIIVLQNVSTGRLQVVEH